MDNMTLKSKRLIREQYIEERESDSLEREGQIRGRGSLEKKRGHFRECRTLERGIFIGGLLGKKKT